MRAPPPVEFQSALRGAWRAAASLLVGAAVGVPLAWGLPWLSVRPGGTLALWLSFGGIAALWFGLRRAASSERTLRWDGREWVLPGESGASPEQRGDAVLMLDLGPWMLVRFTPTRASRPAAIWLPLAVGDDPARWAALRGALWNWRAGRGNAR